MTSSLDTVSAAPSTRKKRWAALDLFRFTAVILMVQGHVFNVVLEESIRPEKWYRWHGYVHGYTAPMFMFASGLAFGITTFRGFEQHTKLGRPVYRRIERYLTIIGIGYLLHVPSFRASSLATADAHQLQTFYKVDALHVIGVTLLLTELLVLLLRDRRRYVVAVAALGFAAVLFAPAMERAPIETFVHPLFAGYLNDHTGALFPIFPWSGFLAAGIVAAHFIQRAFDEGKEAALPAQLTAWAGAALLASLLAHVGLPNVFGEHNLWKTDPLFFGWRIGMLLLVTALFTYYAAFRAARRGADHVPRLHTVQVMGQETLVVYVVHLLVLYGTPLHTGLHRAYGPTLPLSGASLVFLLLFFAMAILAWGWHLLKKKRPKEFDRMRLLLLAVVLLQVFLF